MSLYAAWVKLCDEFDQNIPYFIRLGATRPTSPTDFSLADECELEGHLSRIWQAWGIYCRICVIESCCGTTDGNGVQIVANPHARSEQHVSNAAMRAKAGKTPYWRGTNHVLRFEPTWGDTDILSTIVQRIQPTNHAQLLPAISSAHGSAKALQKIRNAAAHSNSETLLEVTRMQTSYLSFQISHPIQALFWIEQASQDFLVIHAIEELRDAAIAAIS